MQRNYSRLIPLGVLAVMLLALLLAFGPRFYREYRLSRSAAAMLKQAAGGNVSAMLSYVDPAQQQAVGALFSQYLPAGYQDHIRSLKLRNIEILPDGRAWVYVSCNTEGGGDAGFYQAKLLWRHSGGQWSWDFDGSYGSAWALGVEPQWQSLDGYIELADQWQ